MPNSYFENTIQAMFDQSDQISEALLKDLKIPIRVESVKRKHEDNFYINLQAIFDKYDQRFESMYDQSDKIFERQHEE